MSIAETRSRVKTEPVRFHDEVWLRNLAPLACPQCGDVYCHFDLDHVENTDDYTCPLGTRGSWVSLAMWCESCPYRWSLITGFHKGQTYLGTVGRRELRSHGPWELPR